MSTKLKLIQAGVGGMGRAWRKNALTNSPDFDLAAIVDTSPEALREAGEELNIPLDRRFDSLEKALDAVQADALLTVTPPIVHAPHAQLAFSRGLHVLTEKPIAHDLLAAKKMVAQAAAANRQLVVAQNYRYSAPMQRLKSLVSENPLGEFGHGHIDFYIPADFTGSFRESMQYPLLIDMAIHHIDLIRFITGKNLTQITAQTFRPSWSWYAHHPGLKFLAQLEDGLPFSYSGDWSARGRPTTWNGAWRLQFAEGSIHLEDDKITLARSERWSKNQSIESIEIHQAELNGQAALLKNFAAAIRSNQPAETSGADNLWSFAAVIAGVQSAQENRTIGIGELLDFPVRF